MGTFLSRLDIGDRNRLTKAQPQVTLATSTGLIMILIVDDDPTFLEEAEGVLAPERGLLFLRHGREVVRFVQDIGVSVVLVDLNLGEENGFELIRNLRSTDPNLPIIAMSG